MIHALFLAFLILSPTQLGKHWWPEWSLVSGVRVDYLSPTLFFTDIIFVILIMLVLWDKRKRVGTFVTQHIFLFLSLISYLLTLIFLSPRPFLSFYWLLRYGQIPFIALLTRTLIKQKHVNVVGRFVFIGLSIAVIWTVALSIIQLGLGRTTSFLWILGERSFTLSTPGISTILLFGHTMLRPYATFPHPNALAGFLAVCWLLLRNARGSWRKFNQTVRILSGLGVLLTASRLAIASLAIVSFVMVGSGRAISFLIFPPQSVKERVVLARAAVQMIGDYPLLGVGPGQFLVKLPDYLPRGTWLLQPVHNVPLLLLSEFGIVGISLLLWMGWKLMPIFQVPGTRYQVLLFLLLTSLGDHYWLTVQQNRILAGVVIGLWLSRATRGVLEKRRADENAPHPLRTS